jgi:hypothetical protein
MKNHYPNSKFIEAVDGMAMSPKSIQERVVDAYICSLIHVEAEHLPERIQARFKNIERKLTCAETVGDEGLVSAIISQLSTDEAIGIASEITHLAHVVACDYYVN